MHIQKNVDRSFWWEVAESCPYATFYHSPLWHELAERTYSGYESAPIGATSKNGTRMVLPLLRTDARAKGLLSCYVSTFAWCYGGVIADGPVTPNDRYSLYEAVLNGRTDRLQVSGNPFWHECQVEGLETVVQNVTLDEDFTHVLKLDRPIDRLVENFSRSRRRSLETALQKGVTVRQAESLEDYHAYFGAYEDCLRRWGDSTTSRYPWRLFEEVYTLQQQHPENIRLWLAEVKDAVIGGFIGLYWKHFIGTWHGAAYEKYFDYRPYNLLHVTICEHGLDNGYRYYDFGPSGGHEGVANFKQGFHPVKLPFKKGLLLGSKRKLIDNLKNRLPFSGNGHKRLPEEVTANRS